MIDRSSIQCSPNDGTYANTTQCFAADVSGACAIPGASFWGSFKLTTTIRSMACWCDRLSGSDPSVQVDLALKVSGEWTDDGWRISDLVFPGTALGDDRYCEACSETVLRIFEWKVLPSKFHLSCACGVLAPVGAFLSELGFLALPTHPLTLKSSRDAFDAIALTGSKLPPPGHWHSKPNGLTCAQNNSP